MGALTVPFAVPIGMWQSTGVQAGSVPLQVRSAWQVVVAVPDRVYPALHAYVPVEPTVVAVVVTVPCGGLAGVGQYDWLQTGAASLHVPSAWQVRGEVPTSPYPVWQV
jgi:hypothetical protein